VDARDARFRVLRGLIYTKNGQAQRAIQELQDAVALDPDAPGVLSSLAAAHEADGALDKAAETYRQAIDRHPTHWSAYEHLGIFLFRQGKYTEAEKNFVQATRFAPANPQAIRNLAVVYVVQERFAAAEIELVKVTKLAPDAASYNTLGWVFVLEGKFGDAVTALEQAVKLPRANSFVWSSLARAYRWAGGHPEAQRSAYKRALARANDELRLNPSNAEVRSNRAYLLAETGRSEDARRELSRTLALRSAQDNVDVLFDAALIYEWSGDRKRALDHLYLAAQKGYSGSRIERNPDLRTLRSDPGYRRVLDVARPVPN
jgi:Flp pilus assembly protein TadD